MGTTEVHFSDSEHQFSVDGHCLTLSFQEDVIVTTTSYYVSIESIRYTRVRPGRQSKFWSPAQILLTTGNVVHYTNKSSMVDLDRCSFEIVKNDEYTDLSKTVYNDSNDTIVTKMEIKIYTGYPNIRPTMGSILEYHGTSCWGAGRGYTYTFNFKGSNICIMFKKPCRLEVNENGIFIIKMKGTVIKPGTTRTARNVVSIIGDDGCKFLTPVNRRVSRTSSDTVEVDITEEISPIFSLTNDTDEDYKCHMQFELLSSSPVNASLYPSNAWSGR